MKKRKKKKQLNRRRRRFEGLSPLRELVKSHAAKQVFDRELEKLLALARKTHGVQTVEEKEEEAEARLRGEAT